MTIKEKINELEAELKKLREQALIEYEKEKLLAERDNELLSIMNQIKVFNEKYNEHITIAVDRNTSIGKEIWDTFFPWTL